MKIAVFCSSRMGHNKALKELAGALGAWLAGKGHTLIYGGEYYGLMAVLADAVLDGGGRLVGVVPQIPSMLENVHPRLSECIYTQDMADRKRKMLSLADAFIALPGGPGTLDELSEALCANRIGVMAKPLVLLGTAGFYDPIRQLVESMRQEEMIGEQEDRLLLITESLSETEAFLAE